MNRKIHLSAVFILIAMCFLSGCKNIENLTAVNENTSASVKNENTSASVKNENTSASVKSEETVDYIAESTSFSEQTASSEPSGEDWALFVVNEESPLPDGFSIETAPVYKQRELDIRCANYAVQMIQAALDDGIELNVTSGYRSIEKQQENIKFYIENYMEQGYSYEEAEALTMKEVAKPGCSEHNAGVAMDIVTQDWFMSHTELTDDFRYTAEFRWLQDNSWKYGFIMSFPEGKEDITGFAYEPWHYRYVGKEHAERIHELGITLNEYIDLYINI